MKTYFILSRTIFDSAIWRDDPHILKLFIYLIGEARYERDPKKYPTFELKRGDCLTSLKTIADDNEYMVNGSIKKWNRTKVHRMLSLLEDRGYITKVCDTYGTHLSICNYDIYQDPEAYRCNAGETQVKRNCNAGETQVKTTNKEKKDNKEKNIEERKKDFRTQLGESWKKLGANNYLIKDEAEQFFAYWTEHGPNDKKMRFEKETSFAISRRLATWKRNNFNGKAKINPNVRPNA